MSFDRPRDAQPTERGVDSAEGASTARLEAVTLRLAAEITKSAYVDAMRRHGLLPSTISLISGYAEENLAALEHESSDVPTEAWAHILSATTDEG